MVDTPDTFDVRQKMSRRERLNLAQKRITNVLGRHGIACQRTLEQKISDAGPYGQRIDPHVVTNAIKALIEEEKVIRQYHSDVPWYHLPEITGNILKDRLEEQLPVYQSLQGGDLGKRIGQSLEIAIFRSLTKQNNFSNWFGDFPYLENHDDSRMYKKEEPPQAIGGKRLSGKQRLDFLIIDQKVGSVAIEAKNVRPWLYPDSSEIKDLLSKAVALDSVPVLIARRYHFTTFKDLSPCGVIFHETFNQLMPQADQELADKARDKWNLGYHDIRVGNEPDKRLFKFIGTDLPNILPEARNKFEKHKDLLEAFGKGDITKDTLATHVRRIKGGQGDDQNELSL